MTTRSVVSAGRELRTPRRDAGARTCLLCRRTYQPGEPGYAEMMLHDRTETRTRWKCRPCNASRMRKYASTEAGRAAMAETARRSRAKRFGAPGRGITAAEARDLRLFYGNRCMCCGATEHLTLDHIVPLSRGGADSIENLGLLCRSCNASFGARLKGEYRPDGGVLARAIGVRGGKGLPKVSELVKVLRGR